MWDMLRDMEESGPQRSAKARVSRTKKRPSSEVVLELLKTQAEEGDEDGSTIEGVTVEGVGALTGMSAATAWRALDKLDEQGVIRWHPASRKRPGSVRLLSA